MPVVFVPQGVQTNGTQPSFCHLFCVYKINARTYLDSTARGVTLRDSDIICCVSPGATRSITSLVA